MARKNRYPRIQIRQLPIMVEGGSIDPKTTGSFAKTSGTMGTVGGAATTILAPIAQAGEQQNPYKSYMSGNSATQQTVDGLVSMIPGVGQLYTAGKQIGQIAKNDYGAQNEYGELVNTEKFKTADTIGTFIDPLGSFISGISGEGWTANQRADIINDKGAVNRRRVEQQKAIDYKNREIDAGYGGRYQDTNNLMMAKEGGQLGGYYGQGSMMDFEMGGQMTPHQQVTDPNQLPQITKYSGLTHGENPRGGIPVDSQGNPVAHSQKAPAALTEAGEISWKNLKTGQTYIFSNSLFTD